MEKSQKPQTQILCESVFKSGEPSNIKKQLTKKWIELINQLEKNKGLAPGVRQ